MDIKSTVVFKPSISICVTAKEALLGGIEDGRQVSLQGGNGTRSSLLLHQVPCSPLSWGTWVCRGRLSNDLLPLLLQEEVVLGILRSVRS